MKKEALTKLPFFIPIILSCQNADSFVASHHGFLIMRKVVFVIIVVFLSSQLLAQNIKGGLIAGFNVSQVDGDEVFGYHKFGLNAGALAIIPFGEKFSASIETIYNQKGSYQRPLSTDSINGQYKLIINYLEIPVLFNYIDKDAVKFGTGLSWGRLVQFKEWQHGNRINWSANNWPYKKSDVDVLIDVQFKIVSGLYFDFRYAYSVARIREREFHRLTNTWSRNQFNNVLSMRLCYIFKDKPKPKAERNTDKINP